MQEVSRAGVPAQLPVSVVYEGSPSPYSQFMFGPDLLVSPVCEENVQSLWVSLPVSHGRSLPVIVGVARFWQVFVGVVGLCRLGKSF